MCIGGCLGGFFGSCAASCICQTCSGANRNAARFIYAVIFFLSMVLAWIVRDYSDGWLKTLHHFKACPNDTNCLGVEGVVRICFASFVFSFVMWVTTVGTRSKEDCRDSWHCGFWPLKVILWLGLIVVPFFMPGGVFKVFAEISRFGAAVFLLVQLITLLNFIYQWNDSWLSDGNERRCRIPLISTSVLCYILVFVGLVLQYVWFAPRASCGLNIFFITWTLILIITMTIISLHPQVNAGLLTSGVMGLYMVFLCWSAIMSEPYGYSCNTRARQSGHADFVTVVSFILGFLAIILATFSAGGDSKAFEINKTDDTDPDAVPYGYGFFHFVFATGAMYAAMLFLGWNLNQTQKKWSIDAGWISVWVKIISEWVAFLLYGWTMVAPFVLKDRQFS